MAQSTATHSRRRYRIPGAAAYGFLAPAAILVLLFFFIPALIVIFLSLTDLQTANFTSNFGVMARDYFIGTENYRTLFNDQYLQRIFFNTLFYVFLTLSFFNVGMALLVSLLTTHIRAAAVSSSARSGCCRASLRRSSTCSSGSACWRNHPSASPTSSTNCSDSRPSSILPKFPGCSSSSPMASSASASA